MTPDEILKELQLENETAETKHEIIAAFTNVVESRMAGVVDELLSDEQSEEFAKLSEHASDDEVGVWLRATLPQLPELYVRAQRKHLEEIKADIEAVRG